MPEPKYIESTQNPVVKEAALISSKRARFGHEAFLAEGPNLLEAAFAKGSRASVRRLFFTDAFSEREPELLKGLLAAASGAEHYRLSQRAMERICQTRTPQGVAALASCATESLEGLVATAGTLVVADRVSDPGNMGTLIRSADALGASGIVVLEGSADPFGPKALRASAGSAFSLPLGLASEGELLNALEDSGVSLVAASSGEGVPVHEADLRGPVALVLGNEANGVSPLLLEKAAQVVHIPITGSAESLNVTASAAVLLYECLRHPKT